MGPIYDFFGLRAAFVVEELSSEARRHAYDADVTYVTAKEAGFDFLRDRTASDPAHIVHRDHDFAIVDEADFILIDEARVPLVIAGPAPALPIDQAVISALARDLRHGIDYDADEYGRTVVLTETGFRQASARLRRAARRSVEPSAPERGPRGASRARAPEARSRLRRAQRDRGARRRVDRPRCRQPALAARHSARRRSEGAGAGQARGTDPRLDSDAALHPRVREPRRDDGNGGVRVRRVQPVLRPEDGRLPAAPDVRPHGSPGRRLHAPPGQDRRAGRGNRAGPRHATPDPRRHRERAGVGGACRGAVGPAASPARSSTRSRTRTRRRRSQAPARSARSRSRRTWPVAAPISASADRTKRIGMRSSPSAGST